MNASTPSVFEQLVSLGHGDASGPRWLAVFEAAYGAYFDESGTHENSPVCTMAGYIAPAYSLNEDHRSWSWFDGEWRGALKQDDVAILPKDTVPWFHAVKCEGQFKQYNGWSVERCDAHRWKLANIINRRAVLGLSYSVIVKDHERVFLSSLPARIREVYEKPYMLCFRVCLERIVHHRETFGIRPNERIACVFGCNSEMANIATRYYRDLIEIAGWGDIFGSIFFADTRYVLPLQAADYLTYESYRHVKSQFAENDGEPERRYLGWLKKIPYGIEGARHDADTLADVIRRGREAGEW